MGTEAQKDERPLCTLKCGSLLLIVISACLCGHVCTQGHREEVSFKEGEETDRTISPVFDIEEERKI